MARTIEIDPTDPAPIWRQIEEQVRRLVAARVLAPGALVPSVRELSRSLRINPATVAKAYQRLVDAGVLQVRRGEGTYVADKPPAITATERRRTLAESAQRFAGVALSVGAGLDEATEALREAWTDLTDGEKGVGS